MAGLLAFLEALDLGNSFRQRQFTSSNPSIEYLLIDVCCISREGQRALGFDSVYVSLSEETNDWWQNIVRIRCRA